MARAAVWAAATIVLLGIAGCASTDSSTSAASHEPRRCFWARDVRNFAPVNSSTINIRVGRDTFRVDTFGSCRDLDWTNRMALVTTGGSSICVGSGIGASIVTRGPSGRQRCAIQSVTALSPEEVAALPARQRP